MIARDQATSREFGMPGSPIATLAAVALQAVHDAELKLRDAVSVHGLGASAC